MFIILTIAAVGVVLYFVGAIAAHLRVRDTKGLLNPSLPLVLSLVVSVLRIATASHEHGHPSETCGPFHRGTATLSLDQRCP